MKPGERIAAVAGQLDLPVGRPEAERAAFERWCAASGHGTLDDMVAPLDRALRVLA